MSKQEVDSTTLNVLQHKFWQIAEEMAATLVQASSAYPVAQPEGNMMDIEPIKIIYNAYRFWF